MAMNAKHFSAKGDERGTVELPEEVFGQPVHEHAIWEAVRCYLANQRQGTASVKTRAEVSGGGRKPWRQKGTGRARQGSNRSPLWRHGGRAFGPRPRSYNYTLPKKVRSLALRSALSARALDSAVSVVDVLDFAAPRTKDLAGLLKKIGAGEKRCLLVLGDHRPNAYLSGRNIPKLQTIPVRELNPYMVMQSDTIVFEVDGLEKIREVVRV
jgi:large subunit ribosomal protein L4